MAHDQTTTLAVAPVSNDPLPERARAMLAALRAVVPFDAAWLASVDPLDVSYSSLSSLDLDAGVVRYLEGPSMAHDIEVTGTDKARPPLSPSDLPFAAGELPTWAECLHPAGIHEALAVALFTPDARHIGFLALLSSGKSPPAPALRERLTEVLPVLAHGIDPMQSLLTVARLVRGAAAGVILRDD